MKKLKNYGGLILFIWALSTLNSFGQSYTAYEQMIKLLDSKNIDLQSYKYDLDANKLENRIGLTPPNPRVSVSYLKPSPRLRDHTLGYEVTQDFEFPTVYSNRRKLAAEKNNLADIDFKMQRSALIEDALISWSDWVYQVKFVEFLKNQEGYTHQLLESVEKLFENGEISVLERNKVKVYVLNFKKELELAEIDAQNLHQYILLFNQGQNIEFLKPEYPVPFNEVSIKGDLEYWNKHSLSVLSIDQMLAVNQQDLSLRKAQNLPEWSVGWVREQDLDVDFRGVSVGLSIPLWQNKNQLKAAKSRQIALESKKQSVISNIQLQRQQLSQKQVALFDYYDELQRQLEGNRNLELIHKAFALGEISLTDFLVEQSLLIELNQKLLQAELDLSKIWIELRQNIW